jgi:RNA-directed DNA polymerase
VFEAYKRVRVNQGAAGVDEESTADFEKDLKNNLYKIWNRMSSGSYFAPAVQLVGFAKKSGCQRKLGVPTVSDASLLCMSPLKKKFHRNSSS